MKSINPDSDHSSTEAVADRLAECQAQVEATLSRLLSGANASCSTLASRLADLETALDAVSKQVEDANARETRERLRTAERQVELESGLAQAAARREGLERELAESRAVMRRQFEESPLAICRCSRNGRLTQANRAFALLTGYESVDELRNVDFGEVVFESADDLPWLIERCVKSAATQSVEATWRTKEGCRLTVRVSASALAPDAIEIVAEDLTNLRTLQERLGQAQRMEAVGRLASEVAVTCVNLLDDVHQNAHSWLRTAGADESVRRQGEMLLDEVTRAGGFLRQLSVYGNEQTSALAPVDLNKLVRDLGPVLKRVAGDDVVVELPRTMAPMNVDSRSDRVERLLVNLAAYGRERMPFGGRLKIELATVTVDQAFIEKHPNVRQGPNALITVTEIRRTTRAEGPLRLREWPADTRSDRESSGKLGVDLGALQGLISDCNGHLWVTAVPHGDLVVQIHLPLRYSEQQKKPRLQARPPGQPLAASSR